MQFIINFTVPAREGKRRQHQHTHTGLRHRKWFSRWTWISLLPFWSSLSVTIPHCFGQPWCSWQDSILKPIFSAEFPSQHRPADRHHSLHLIILSSSTMIPERKGWSFVFTHVLHQYP